jgi:REP element-mobilizing transposase RayT
MRRNLATDEALLQRKPLRLRGYDYAEPGTYFVTVTTHDRICWFGEVVNGGMRLTEIGHVVHEEWSAIPDRRTGVELDAFVVMPNHVHGVVRILSNARGEASLAPTRAAAGASRGSLGSIVGSFKAGVSRRVSRMRSSDRVVLWQSGYHDHIVRTEGELDRIRAYIAANPANWPVDPENADRTAGATQASPPQGQDEEAWHP